MSDIIIETCRALIVGFLFVFLLLDRRINEVRTIHGWNLIISGFGFILFGMVVDITDNFEQLNRFVIIGDTEYQAFIEKIIGYLLGFLMLAAGIWKWIPGIIELENARKRALDKASEEIKTLTGLLPICMDCKKIRDDSGYWNQLEKYISEHSDVQLSHGLCDECMNIRYPEFAEDTV